MYCRSSIGVSLVSLRFDETDSLFDNVNWEANAHGTIVDLVGWKLIARGEWLSYPFTD